MKGVKAKLMRLRLEQLNVALPEIRSGRERLGELATSIDDMGILVPPVVRPLGGARGAAAEYAVVAGVGRVQALRLTGAGPKTVVVCLVVEVDDAEATLLALVENVVREDMRPFDEAETARVLIEEYGYTQERVAQALGAGQAGVSKKLAVFRLDPKVVAALRKGVIEMGPARALLPLVDDRAAQRRILERMVAERLTAAQVTSLVAAVRFGEVAVTPLRYELAGAGKVEARTTAKGKVRVVLEADDRRSLEKLWRSLKEKMF